MNIAHITIKYSRAIKSISYTKWVIDGVKYVHYPITGDGNISDYVSYYINSGNAIQIMEFVRSSQYFEI